LIELRRVFDQAGGEQRRCLPSSKKGDFDPKSAQEESQSEKSIRDKLHLIFFFSFM